MARLRQGRTSFVIAHRLSTIRKADSIVVMDGGRIVEQGTHAELIGREGFYYNLYNSQFTDAWAEGDGRKAGSNGQSPVPQGGAVRAGT